MSVKGKRICIFGLQGSGKTILSKMLGLNYRTLVFDILGEYRSDLYYVWKPEAQQYGEELTREFDSAMQQFVFSKKYHWDLLIVDEASQYFPNRKSLPAAMMRLNDFNRHMGMAFVCVARRPTQLNTDLVELAHYNIFFRLTGRNDMQFLRDLYPGLDSAVFGLGPHEFIVFEAGKGFYKCKPVNLTN